ncbi:MAG: AGE family epimerase/isomerase [Opitutaceae bacterium]
MNPPDQASDAGLRSALESKRTCEAALRQLRQGERPPMAQWLRAHLFGHVMPFWEKHGVDELGGFNTCVDDTGRILSTDKWLWSQWRAVWVFSRIHNRIDPDPRWLRSAKEIAAFCVKNGWDDRAEGWVLTVARNGTVLRGCESIYTDAFAVYGLVELYQATRDPETLQLACQTADAALRKLAGPHDAIPHFPYPIPAGAKPHGIPMMWSLVLAELGHVVESERYLAAAASLAAEIFRDFYRRDRDLIFEFVHADGSRFPGPQGNAIVPGHVVEDMWFQIHVAELTGSTSPGRDEMLRLTLRHLDAGWDAAHGGGLLLAIDADGRTPVGWNFADTKLWWPQTEALYVTLLGAIQTGRPVFLDWYEKLWRLCLDHYVDWENGEWRQKLDRSLVPLQNVVALPVKDPFHLPRSLILQIELLEAAGSSRRA